MGLLGFIKRLWSAWKMAAEKEELAKNVPEHQEPALVRAVNKNRSGLMSVEGDRLLMLSGDILELFREIGPFYNVVMQSESRFIIIPMENGKRRISRRTSRVAVIQSTNMSKSFTNHVPIGMAPRNMLVFAKEIISDKGTLSILVDMNRMYPREPSLRVDNDTVPKKPVELPFQHKKKAWNGGLYLIIGHDLVSASNHLRKAFGLEPVGSGGIFLGIEEGKMVLTSIKNRSSIRLASAKFRSEKAHKKLKKALHTFLTDDQISVLMKELKSGNVLVIPVEEEGFKPQPDKGYLAKRIYRPTRRIRNAETKNIIDKA